jgi:hypothetical protein
VPYGISCSTIRSSSRSSQNRTLSAPATPSLQCSVKNAFRIPIHSIGLKDTTSAGAP